MSKCYNFTPEYTAAMKVHNVEQVLQGKFDNLHLPKEIMLSHSCIAYRDTIRGYDPMIHPCTTWPDLRITTMAELEKFLDNTPGEIKDENGVSHDVADYIHELYASATKALPSHLRHENEHIRISKKLPFWFEDFE